MRKGERPDELVAHVKLPPHLAESPYLQEYYGTVEWSVRAIYSDHLGWFDGNATHLFPMPETERAQRIVALAGGVPQTLSRGREALARSDFRWAAELADCRAGRGRRQRRREAPQGAGPDGTRRAPDERQRQELLPLGRPVPAARPAAAVGTVTRMAHSPLVPAGTARRGCARDCRFRRRASGLAADRKAIVPAAEPSSRPVTTVLLRRHHYTFTSRFCTPPTQGFSLLPFGIRLDRRRSFAHATAVR